MNRNEIILNELRQISPVVAGINNHNVYSVPQDYFQSLSDEISVRIIVPNLPAEMPYAVPADYFSGLPFNIMSRLKENVVFNPAASNKSLPVYSVPEGYFNTLAGNILQRVKANTGNEVSEELEAISPLINSISRANVYSVPELYFETVNLVVANAPNETWHKAKVVEMKSGSKSWFRYAAAACVAALIITGAYLFFNVPAAGSKQNSGTQIASIGTESKNIDIDKSIAALSDDEINNYLAKDVSNSIYDYSGAETYDPDIDNLLQSASDEELQKYLDENPELPEIHS